MFLIGVGVYDDAREQAVKERAGCERKKTGKIAWTKIAARHKDVSFATPLSA